MKTTISPKSKNYKSRKYIEVMPEYKPRPIKKNRTHQLVRKSDRVPVGSFYDNTHFMIDVETSEAVLTAFCKWCETGNDEIFNKDMEYLKQVYGTDYLKKTPFSD